MLPVVSTSPSAHQTHISGDIFDRITDVSSEDQAKRLRIELSNCLKEYTILVDGIGYKLRKVFFEGRPFGTLAIDLELSEKILEKKLCLNGDGGDYVLVTGRIGRGAISLSVPVSTLSERGKLIP